MLFYYCLNTYMSILQQIYHFVKKITNIYEIFHKVIVYCLSISYH